VSDEPIAETGEQPESGPGADYVDVSPAERARSTARATRPQMPAWGYLLIGLSLAVGVVAGLFIGLAIGDDGTAAAAPATTSELTSDQPSPTLAPVASETTTSSPSSAGPALEAAAFGTVTVSGPTLPVLGTTEQDLAVGTPVPELAGHDFDGNGVAVIDDGRAKLIMFVAHWCPYCQQELPVVNDWLAGDPLPENVDMYTATIWSDPSRDNFPPGTWLANEDFAGTVIADDADNSIATAFGVAAVPFWVLVNEDGTLAARGSGAIPEEALTEIVAQLAAGPDPTEPSDS
jgi:thiol-disulfide isomerase/thioredoxin